MWEETAEDIYVRAHPYAVSRCVMNPFQMPEESANQTSSHFRYTLLGLGSATFTGAEASKDPM